MYPFSCILDLVQVQGVGRFIGYGSELDLPLVVDQLTGNRYEKVQVDLSVSLGYLFALCHDSNFREFDQGHIFARDTVMGYLFDQVFFTFVIRPGNLTGQLFAGIRNRLLHLRLRDTYACQTALGGA